MLLSGKYQAIRLMSNKGGFGDTYEVTNRGVSEVLKVLKSDDVKAIELFEREFRVLKNLTSKDIAGIPRVKDFFLYLPCNSPPAIQCLVMERIQGLDLEEYLKTRGRPIDEKMAIEWISKLTSILQQVHDQGILHRDIKPSNIMLQPNGQLVLIDFGAAKEAAASIPGQSTCIYTPGYAAPEQYKSGRTSAKSDFFALGRTFVYLLTAEHPMHLYNSSLDSLQWRDKSKNISPEFLDLIDHLMQEDPQLRPNNLTDIITAINVLLGNSLNLKPSVPKPPPNPDPNLSSSKPTSASLSITQQPTVPPSQPSSNTQQPTVLPSQPLSNTQQPTILPSQPSSNTQQSTVPPSQPSSNTQQSASNPKSVNKLIPALAILCALILLTLIGIRFWPSKEKELDKFTDVQNVPSGKFKVGGSTTWATTRQQQALINTAIQGAFGNFKVEYVDASSALLTSATGDKCDNKPGSNAGICLLIAGGLDFAQSSVPLEKSKYANKAQAQHLKEEAVAYDALSIVVNPDLEINNLTMAQLRDIYSGIVKNWSQVGGPNLPIEAFSRREDSAGSVSVFKNLVLNGNNMGSHVIMVDNTTQGLNKVKSSKGGIYYGAAKEVIVDFCETKPLAINSVKPYLEPLQTPNTCGDSNRNKINRDVIETHQYPLIRKIYVVIKADGSIKQQAGEAYVKLLKTKQGQEILGSAGFVGIK
jgi:serine/threonine protein kinase